MSARTSRDPEGPASVDTRQVRALGQGAQAPLGSVVDADLAQRLKQYKRVIAGRYRALSGDEIEALTPPGPLLVSPKLDGELWFLVVEGGDVFLANPGGRVIFGAVPVLDEARALLLDRVSTQEPRTVIAGELYAERAAGRPRHDDLAAALGGEAVAEVDRVRFAAFDLVWGGDRTQVGPFERYADKLAVLQGLLAGGTRVQVVDTQPMAGAADVRAAYAAQVSSGAVEGLVLRTEDGRTFKLKPSLTLDAVVIGYTERAETPGVVRSLALALIREDGQFHLIGSCGNMDVATREALFARLEPLGAPTHFRYASSSGALYRFVRPEVVIEIKITDVLADEPSGDPITRMVATYEAEAGWRAVRPMPGVSILHPVFVRVRDDKQADAVDARMAQVSERVWVPELAVHAEAVALPASEIIQRKVFTKTTKGKVAVRKLVVWQTHKEAVDPRYPAFVVHFTDYSPGRKEPLQREVRPAMTAAEADALAEALLAANIKRGWVEAGA